MAKAKQEQKTSKQFVAMEEAALKAYEEDLRGWRVSRQVCVCVCVCVCVRDNAARSSRFFCLFR